MKMLFLKVFFSINLSGASAIVSYFALEIAKKLNKINKIFFLLVFLKMEILDYLVKKTYFP